MSQGVGPVCAGCQAAIAVDVLRESGTATCPFCGADVSFLLTAPPVPGEWPRSGLPTGPIPESEEIHPTLPGESRIEVIEESSDRLVLYLPPGKSGKALGCFAISWILFMLVFTTMFVMTAFLGIGKFEGSRTVGVLVISVFWAVGLGIGYASLKLRFERTLLYLDRTQGVLQKTLFRRQRRTVAPWDDEPRAELQEVYSQNDVPVHRIVLSGGGRTLGFATSLTEEEKDWLVDRINRFLGAASDTPETPALNAESMLPIRPADLPADSLISVDLDTPDRLQISYPGTDNPILRWVFPALALAFSSAWLAGIATFASGVLQIPWTPVRIGMLCVSIPFFFAGLLPLVMGLFVLLGRTVLELSRETFCCRWRIGPLGYSRSLPTRDIESIGLDQRAARGRSQQRVLRTVQDSQSDGVVCTVRGAGKTIVLTFIHESRFNEEVAALLITRLHSWNHPAGRVVGEHPGA